MTGPSQRNRVRFGIRLAAVVCAVLIVGATAANAGGVCTSARIDEPFALPDGSEHPAGRLTICLERHHSPVASLHEMLVDGMPVAMFQSDRRSSEGHSSERSYIVFDRGADGALVLTGFATPGRERMELYTLRFGKGSRRSEIRSWSDVAAGIRITADIGRAPRSIR